MPFVKKNDSKGSQPSIDGQKVFIGRNTELHFFTENILKPKDPTYNIVPVSGQGGVGKSTLLTRFIEEACKPDFKGYCLTALVDERQTTPAGMMEKFADQLPMESDFGKALRQYKEVLHKLQDEREAARTALLRKTTADIAGAVVKDVPFVGGILQEGIGAATGYLFDELRYRQMLKDAERLEDPVGDLTKAFVSELNRLADTYVLIGSLRAERRRRVILFFDTFERLASEATPWLLNSFLEANISNQVVLVIAGRDPLEQSTPDDPKRWLPYHDDGTIYSIALNSFTEEETRAYLEGRGMTDPDRIDAIWKLSHGLPLYLGFLTSNPQGTVDPTANVVANFLRWIPEQEQIKRQLALDAALFSKTFNQDDLEAFTYLPEQERPDLYRWLIGLPFVRSQDGHYHYHEIAQDLFSRYLYQRSKKAYYASRRALADYYQQSLEELQQEGSKEVDDSREWMDLVLARAYQLFFLPDEASHLQALEQLLNAFYSYGAQPGEIARILRDISQKQATPTDLSAQRTVTLLLYYLESDWFSPEGVDATSELLEYVVQTPSFPRELLVQIYRQYAEANFLLGKRQSIEAYRHFLEYVAPTDYLSRAWGYFRLGDLQQALDECNHALDLDPNNASAYALRGWMYLNLNEPQRAIEDFNRVLKLAPNTPYFYNGLGAAHLSLKEYQQAIEAFENSLKHDVMVADNVYSDLVEAYLSLNKPQQAAETLDRAFELSEKDVHLCSELGKAYSRLGDLQKALAAFDCALELNPRSPSVYMQRGWTYLTSGEYQRAIADFDHTLEIDPDNAGAHNGRGWSYYYLGEYQQAIKAFDQALELDPNFTASLRGLGLAYHYSGDYQQALATFDDYIKLDDKNPFVYTDRGWCYSTLKEYHKALADFDHALELNANFANSYTGRGWAYYNLNDVERAKANFDRALELDPNDAAAYNGRIWIYRQLKEYQLALADCNRFIEVRPNYYWAHFQRGWAYLWLKEIRQARADFTQSWELDLTVVQNGWMTEWTRICQERPDSVMAERLDTIAAIDPQDYWSHVCRGVAIWLREGFEEALAEIELAIALNPEMWGAYFWKGMVCASLDRNEETMAAIEKALALELPPILLIPLCWFEQERPDFYQKDVVTLLTKYKVLDNFYQA